MATARKKLYGLAWSGDRKIGDDGKLPPIGNTVKVENANYTNTDLVNAVTTDAPAGVKVRCRRR